MPDDVRLRAILPDDLPILYEHQRDPVATQMADFPARGWDNFVAHWGRVLANPANTARAILLDGEVAGNIGCWLQDGAMHVGYWIGREFWGRGIATRALAALLAEITVRPFHAEVARHNHASLRVLQKCGFVVGGENAAVFELRLDAVGAASPR